MNRILPKKIMLALLTVASVGLFACSAPTEEGAIEDFQITVETLVDNMVAVGDQIANIGTEIDSLRLEVGALRKFRQDGGGASEDFSMDIEKLETDVKNLKSRLTSAETIANKASADASTALKRSGGFSGNRSTTAKKDTASSNRTKVGKGVIEQALPNGHYYYAKEGDTVESVAKSYGMSVAQFRKKAEVSSTATGLVAGNKIWCAFPKPSN